MIKQAFCFRTQDKTQDFVSFRTKTHTSLHGKLCVLPEVGNPRQENAHHERKCSSALRFVFKTDSKKGIYKKYVSKLDFKKGILKNGSLKKGFKKGILKKGNKKKDLKKRII